MAEILGKPMIGHVYEKVARCPLVTETVVATCDKVIYDYILSIQGKAVMTSDAHERASDRCAEALLILEKKRKVRFDIVIMVQGDEPMIDPKMIQQALEPMLQKEDILVANLVGEIKSKEEFNDRNCIKVVCDLNGNALYFSREPIPCCSRAIKVHLQKQICVIPFRRDFLLKYNQLSPTPLEIAESVDMNRVLEHGYQVRMIKTKHQTFSVDTPEDLKKVEMRMK